MFHWFLSALLLFPLSGHAQPAPKKAPAPALKKYVKSCEKIATGACFKVDGIGRSYMGLFTGLAIEPHKSSQHYSVMEVSLEAVAPRQNCDLKMDCVGTFELCPIPGSRIHDRPNVCLQSMAHITHVPTEAGSFKLYQ